eukprot:m.117702 g.117702  ORF g.117702 m.117702 type:complete len:145 (-) comp13633_c0_seq4:89-523(-)
MVTLFHKSMTLIHILIFVSTFTRCAPLRLRREASFATLVFDMDVGRDSSTEKAALITLVTTHVLFSVGVGTYHYKAPRLWDYIFTIAVLHLCLSCLVTLEAPRYYRWWLTHLIMTLGDCALTFGASILTAKAFAPSTKVLPSIA